MGAWCRKRRTIFLRHSLLHQDEDGWQLGHNLLGRGFVRDVLLHQMVHQYVDLVRGVPHEGREDAPTGSPHNNHWWVAEINRLSEVLRLPGRRAAVRPASREARIHGARALKTWEMAHWPYSVRPQGFYEAEVERVLDLSPVR